MAPGEDAEHGAAGGEPGRRLVSLEKRPHLAGTSSLRHVGSQVLRASVTTISMNKRGCKLMGIKYLTLSFFHNFPNKTINNQVSLVTSG